MVLQSILLKESRYHSNNTIRTNLPKMSRMCNLPLFSHYRVILQQKLTLRFNRIKRKVYFHYIYSFLTYEQEIYTIIIVDRVVLCICHLLTDIKWSQVHQQHHIRLQPIQRLLILLSSFYLLSISSRIGLSILFLVSVDSTSSKDIELAIV